MMDSMTLQQELFVALLVLGTYNLVILCLPQVIDFVLFAIHRVIINDENTNIVGIYFKKYVTKTFNMRHETVTRALTYLSL